MSKHNYNLTDAVTDLAKTAGKVVVTGVGRMLAVGTAAALFGGVGGGVVSMVYGMPFVASILAGAAITVVAVFALYLLLAINS